MKVLSLFDGMSCGQLALKKLGVKVDAYYAAEIDKHAIKVAMANFPNTIQLGDVRGIKAHDLPKIDLLLGGSPCQGFSRAGKGLNFDDERSKLFFEYVRILNELKAINPNIKFLLENVDMDKWCLGVISEYLGVFPVKINSALVSAQNRVRWYWTNIKTRQEGFFGEVHSDIPQPKDRGILLKDILQDESEIDEKYYISETQMKRLYASGIIKGGANQFSEERGRKQQSNSSNGKRLQGGVRETGIQHSKREFEAININGKSKTLRKGGAKSMSNKHNYDIIKISKVGGMKKNQDKASTICGGAHSGGNHSDMDIICVAQRGRGENNQQTLELQESGKTNALTTVSKDKLVIQLNPSKESHGQQPFQQNRIYSIEGKNPTLSSQLTKGSNMILDYRLRRLTPIECERLQGVPDNYTSCVSDSQRYKMLGNGWQIDTIEHILTFLTPQ